MKTFTGRLAVLLLVLTAATLGAPPDTGRFKLTAEDMYRPDLIRARRVALSPLKADSGMATGFVILYGHYIEPPYAVEVRSCSVLVNGVPVYPAIRPGPAERDTTNLAPPAVYIALAHLRDLEREVMTGYRRDIERGLSPAAAAKAARSTLMEDDLVDSVADIDGDGIRVYTRDPVVDGKRYPIAGREIWFDVALKARVSTAPPERRQAELCEPLARVTFDMVTAVLKRGGCFVSGFGFTIGGGQPYARDLAPVLLRTELSDKDFWVEVMKVVSYTDALYYTANRQTALNSWRALSARLARGR